MAPSSYVISELFVLFFMVTSGLSACHGAEGHDALGRVILSREFLLSLLTLTAAVIPDSIPRELCRPVTKTWKRGRRGGLRRRLKNLRLDDRRKLPPLLTILLSSVQSIRNMLDELEAWAKFKREIKESCLLTFTRTRT